MTQPTPTVLLEEYLRALKLSAMLRAHPVVSRQAADQKATYEQFLQQLTELEVHQRHTASIQRRVKAANPRIFSVLKELDAFDFTATSGGAQAQQAPGARAGPMLIHRATVQPYPQRPIAPEARVRRT